MKQIQLLSKFRSAYGGELLKTRAGRASGRPISVKYTMHLVLRSSKAKAAWSFRRGDNPVKIKKIFERFGMKYGIDICRLANVGNHLHLQIKVRNRHTFAPFIRAVTAAITHAVTRKVRTDARKLSRGDRFFDYRPFTRFVVGLRALLTLREYIEINELEGHGWNRAQAALWISSRSENRKFSASG